MKTIQLTAALLLLSLAACVTPMGIAPSNIPITPEQITKTIGPAEGTSSAWSFSPLCLFSLGHPDFDEAIKAALETSQGDALIDIIVADTHTCYLGERGALQDWGHGCGRCPACRLRADGFAKWTSTR